MSVGTATHASIEGILGRWELAETIPEASYWRLPVREAGVCSVGHVGTQRGDVWFCDRYFCGEVWRWPSLVGGD